MKKPIIQIIKDVCFHEAGHYVIGKRLGFQVLGVNIRIEDLFGAYSGGCTIKLPSPIRNMKDSIDYIERRCKVLYAGALAQSIDNGIAKNEEAIRVIRGQEGAGDHAKARELIQILRNIKYPDFNSDEEAQNRLTGIDQTIWKETTALVNAETSAIGKLASGLSQQVKSVGLDYSFTQGQCEEALK